MQEKWWAQRRSLSSLSQEFYGQQRRWNQICQELRVLTICQAGDYDLAFSCLHSP